MHNYQLMQQTRMMRKMDHCRLIDEIHLPLKNFAAVDSNKETISEFQSTFVKPQKQISKRTDLGLLKVKGAEFIVSILDDLRECKGQALKAPRPKGKPKSMTYWKPPSVYGGDSIVPLQVFPLWFQFLGKEPQPTRLVYLKKKLDFRQTKSWN